VLQSRNVKTPTRWQKRTRLLLTTAGNWRIK